MRILLALLLISGICSAQDSKIKNETLADGSVLTYGSLYGNLNGPYTIAIDKDPILRGTYNNGKRTGNWFFFNRDKSLFMRYNYDINKLLSIDDKKLAVGRVTVLSPDETVNKSASVPIPLMSLDQYFALISEEVKKVLPKNLSRNATKMETTIVAKVDAQGFANYEVLYKVKGKETSQKFTPHFGTVNIEWIPAMYEGKGYPSEFSFVSELELGQNSDATKRFYWGPRTS